MRDFERFWADYVFFEGFASDRRKASRGSTNKKVAGLQATLYSVSLHDSTVQACTAVVYGDYWDSRGPEVPLVLTEFDGFDGTSQGGQGLLWF